MAEAEGLAVPSTLSDLETLGALRTEVAPLAASAWKVRIGIAPNPSVQMNRSATFVSIWHITTSTTLNPEWLSAKRP